MTLRVDVTFEPWNVGLIPRYPISVTLAGSRISSLIMRNCGTIYTLPPFPRHRLLSRLRYCRPHHPFLKTPEASSGYWPLASAYRGPDVRPKF